MQTTAKRPPLFPLGDIYLTPGAIEVLTTCNQDVGKLLSRHVRGDWGDVCEEDKSLNDQSVTDGTRILSAYPLSNGERLWIITEADRSSTTVLKPDEY